MSGGHFDYNQYRIEDIAAEIDVMIESNDDDTLDVFGTRRGYGYPPEVIEKFKEAAHTLRQAAEMAQRVDWLVSGDDGEDSFMLRWQKEVRPYWEAPAPPRPPLGTRVKHTTHGEGKIFSYEHCDDVSCGVDFGRKGQWCIDIRELIIPPSTQALVRSAAPTARELAEKFDGEPLSEEQQKKNLAAAKLRYHQ